MKWENSNFTTLSNFVFSPRPTPSDTDFNSIIQTGIYWVDTNVTNINHPCNGYFGFLEVSKVNDNAIFQRFTRYASENRFTKYTRMYINGTWSGWSQDVLFNEYNTQINALHEAKVNHSGLAYTDLNNYTISGFYRLHTSENTANMPSEMNYGQMLVVHGLNDTIAQIGFNYTNSKEFYMRCGNPSNVGGHGSWQPWSKFIGVNI